MEWLPTDADMHFALGIVVGGLIVGAALWPTSGSTRPPPRGRHHRKDEP